MHEERTELAHEPSAPDQATPTSDPADDSTDTPADDTTGGKEPDQGKWALIRTILIDVISPLIGFYGLRAFGFDQWLALALGGIGPAANAIYMIIKHRKADTLALFMLSLTALTVLTSYLTGDPRLLLAREGWISGVIGLWMMATIFWFRYPFCFSFGRALMQRLTAKPGRTQRKFGGARYWDERWETSAPFRRIWKVMTAIWATGGILDAVTRVIMAYTLPVDIVPALHVILYFVLYAIMQGLTLLYTRRPDNKQLLWSAPAAG